MLITGAKIISLDSKNSLYDWMTIHNRKIAQMGVGTPPQQLSELPKLQFDGKTILPGFIDTHCHFSSYGLFSIGLDLRKSKDFKHLAEQIRLYSENREEKGPVLAFGISEYSLKEQRLPEREELDKILPDTPILIIKYDGHACIGNTKMLEWLKLPLNMRGYKGGETFSQKTGHFVTDAYYAAVSAITATIPQARLIKAIVNASNRALSAGTTTCHTMEGVGFKNDKDLKGILDAQLVINEKLVVYFQKFDVERVRSFKLPRIGGCFSCAVDGAFGSANAALFEPYLSHWSNQDLGVVYHEQEEMDAFVLAAHTAGLQISTHAIGDRAIEIAITAIERAQKKIPRDDCRHRIEHAEIPTRSQIERMAAAKIAVATQPCFLTNPLEPIWYIEELLGAERAKRLLPLRTMHDAGILLTGGSDAPVTLIDPIAGIYAACNHPNSDQSLDIETALRMYTSDAAAIGFEENEKGSLESGKFADFVVLNKNPLAMKPENLGELKIEETYTNSEKFQPQPDGLLPFVGKLLRRKLFSA